MGPIGQLSTGLQSLTLAGSEFREVEEADAVDPLWSFLDREGHHIYYEDDPEEYEYWWHTGMSAFFPDVYTLYTNIVKMMMMLEMVDGQLARTYFVPILY